MLIWSRGGILAPIMAAFSLILTEYLVNISFNQIYSTFHCRSIMSIIRTHSK